MDTQKIDEIVAGVVQEFDGQMAALALTGSVATGLATPKSDADLIMLVNEASELPDGQHIVRRIADVHVEILILTAARFSELVKATQVPSYFAHPLNMTMALRRVMSAKPVHGRDKWNAFLADFDRRHFQTCLSELNQQKALLCIEDFWGETSIGESRSALHRIREVLYHLLEALLCLHGDTNGRRKWIVRRVADAPIGDADFRNAILDCYLGIRPRGGDRLTRDIQETAWFCTAVSRLILRWRLDCQSRDIDLPEGDASLPNGLALVVFIGGRYILKSSHSVAEIDEAMAFLFCCAQDKTADLEQADVDRFFSGSRDEVLEEIKARNAQLAEISQTSRLFPSSG